MPENNRPRVTKDLLTGVPVRRRRVYAVLVACVVAAACLKPGALLAVVGYQRFISPQKGYQCAHAALYGGPSCSEFGKRAIQQYGVIGGLILLRQRFQACHQAAVAIRSDRDRGKREGKETRQYCFGCAEGCCSDQ